MMPMPSMRLRALFLLLLLTGSIFLIDKAWQIDRPIFRTEPREEAKYIRHVYAEQTVGQSFVVRQAGELSQVGVYFDTKYRDSQHGILLSLYGNDQLEPLRTSGIKPSAIPEDPGVHTNFSFSPLLHEENAIYTIRFSSNEPSREIAPRIRFQISSDLYKHGNMSIGGEVSYGDLAFTIWQKHSPPSFLMSLALLLAITSILLFTLIPEVRRFLEKRNAWIAPIVIITILASLMAVPLFENAGSIGQQDWGKQVSYEGIARKTMVSYQQLPLWDPWMCGGTPLLANPESTFLSPLFVFPLIFGEVLGLKINIIVHILAGMFGLYLLGKFLKLRFPVIYLPLIVFFLGSHFFARFWAGHTMWMSLAWVPWILLTILWSRRNVNWSLVTSLLLALMLLEGSPHIFGYSVFAITISAVLFAIYYRSFWPIKSLALIGIFTFLFAAIKFLPSWQLTSNFSPGHVGLADHTLKDLFDIFLNPSPDTLTPREYGWHEYSSYIGVGPVLLAVAGALFVWRKAWIWAGLAIAFLLLSLGLPPWEQLTSLPGFTNLRQPSRLSIFAILFLSLASAYGLRALSRKVFARNTYAQNALASIIIVLVLISILPWGTSFLRETFVIPAADKEQGQFQQNARIPDEWNGFNISPLDFPSYVPLPERKSTDAPRVNFPSYAFFLKNKGSIVSCPSVHVPNSAKPSDIENVSYRGEVYALAGTAEYIMWSPNKLKIKYDFPEDSRVIVNQNYHSGWRSNEGNVEEYEGLISVMVKKGEGEITLRYTSPYFLLGLAISSISALLVIVYLVFASRRTKKENE